MSHVNPFLVDTTVSHRPLLRTWALRSTAIAAAVAAVGGCGDAVRHGSVRASAARIEPAPPDATAAGPLAVTSAEYKLPAAVDPDVLAGRATEVWGKVYRPTDLSAGPYPLLVFLHGNHGTCGRGSSPRRDFSCEYTDTGACPTGSVVAPSHAGYAYLAERLASWGYVVSSINVNRGINCAFGVTGDLGLNLARGRMVLKHLQRLSEWNATPGTTPTSLGVDLAGTIDFGAIGLLGHSRGGEGVRAAYNQYRDAGSPWPARIKGSTVASFEGIFEIGPVDGQTARVLNADGVPWNVLLPMCDGDVSNLQGVKPFDRMLGLADDPPTPKSTYTVWGTNHNFFNTEWQVSDSSGCMGHKAIFSTGPTVVGSPEQRSVGLQAVMAFFRGYVGNESTPTFGLYARSFDPAYALPATVTRIDRGYTPSPVASETLEDFNGGAGLSSYGFPEKAIGVGVSHGGVPEHDAGLTAGQFSWSSGGAGTYYESDFTAPGSGLNLTTFATIDLRVSRQVSTLNTTPTTSFSIRLVNADGTVSAPVSLSDYTDLTGPVGGPYGNPHRILQTARIPIGDFVGANLPAVQGIRLVFDDTDSGAIYIANIRAVTQSDTAASVSFSREASDVATLSTPAVVHDEGNFVVSVRDASREDANVGAGGDVDIEVASATRFPVRDEIAVLRIGDVESTLGGYGAGGDTTHMVFRLTRADFDKASGAISVQFGRDAAHERWSFGNLDKSRLNR